MKRTLLTAVLCLATAFATRAAEVNVHNIPFKDIDGNDTSLKAHEGKVVLVVNTASRCGLTPQYKGLEALYQQHKDKGLVVVGFPCNDFGAQEPGTNAEIKEFCSARYKVTFPMMDKVHVKGPQQHPLYAALSGKDGAFPGDVKWNFGKFLVGKDGRVLARFEPSTKPDSPEIAKAIASALGG